MKKKIIKNKKIDPTKEKAGSQRRIWDLNRIRKRNKLVNQALKLKNRNKNTKSSSREREREIKIDRRVWV